MPMAADDIIRLIKEGIPDAEVEVLDLDLGVRNAFLDQADDVVGGHRHSLVFLRYSVAFI